MNLRKKKFIRIIPRLDIKNNFLIKGINLEGLRVLGEPYQFAKFYSETGADEIHYFDSVASLYGTNNLGNLINITAKNLNIPLCVGGGIRSIEEGKNLIKKYDGEFPDRYFKEILSYIKLKPQIFFQLQDKFRSPHLWKKLKGRWYLRHNCWGGGVDD